MKIEIFKGNWSIDDVKDSTKIFVFGDNNARIGKGGQAIIRDCDNSMGIRTKKGPSKKSAAFYSDDDLDLNKQKILEDILNIKYESISKNKTIVLSKGGYGTGLANLKEKAPLTFEYLNKLLMSYFNFDNERGVKFSKIPGHDEIINGLNIDLETEFIKPVNNSFFKSEFLESGLNTHFDLIKSGSKSAFTSLRKYDINNTLIIKGNFHSLVCRVVDSIDVNTITKDMWYEFEGYNKNFEIDFNIKLYQTHIEFICTLDQNGKMIFKDDLFGEPVDLKKKHEEKGESIKVIKKIDKRKTFKKYSFDELLNFMGIKNYEKNFINNENHLFNKTWEVRFNNFYYYFKLKNSLFSNKLELLFISKSKI